ncbi:uncharacterized protein LOC129802464 isoform X7 [Phlebotomus papatasi]|uniref:uncharacterized protein LOC129802464 isoform X7 n=2 Tax=Phlebotomus papatasi TaxID=29031 RepID=UPI0024835334|nr:uncharacterized protein LOC129802464 isoform X7 [Phlebotomus papatasi]
MPRNKRRRSNNRRRAPREVQNSREGDELCEKVASDDGIQPSEEDGPNAVGDEGVSAAESEISLHTDEEDGAKGGTDSVLCDDKEIPSDKVIHENSEATQCDATSSAQGQCDEVSDDHQSQTDDKMPPNYRVESPSISSSGGVIRKCHSLGETNVQIQELSSGGSSLVNSFDNPGNVSEPESSELEEDPFQDPSTPTNEDPGVQDESKDLTRDQEAKINDLIFSFMESAPSREKSPPDPLAQKRAEKTRKRAAIESHFAPQILNPRLLDSIREESSDTDGASDRLFVDNNPQPEEEDMFNEEDDDVFIDNAKITKKANAVFPRGITLDLSTRRKHISALRKPTSGIIREEPVCMLVDTKIIEPESIPGSSTSWETTKTDEIQGAEVVYLESGSSSASELDYSADGDVEDSVTEDIDIRIDTPVIEPEVPAVVSTTVDSQSCKSPINNHPPSPEPLPNPDECDIPDTPEFNRQDSSGSVSSQTHSTSSHSQCTARYMASSLTDIEGDFESSAIAGAPESPCDYQSDMAPKSLRQQCIDRLSTMPYGEVILKELADVSQNISNLLTQARAVSTSTPPPPVPALPARELLIDVLDPLQDHHFYSSDPQLAQMETPPPVPERPATEYPSAAHGAVHRHGSRPTDTIACAIKDDNRLLAIIRESEHEHQQSETVSVDSQSSETNPQARDVTMVHDPREFDNMFEAIAKRFSNYELGHGGAQHATTTKRYSNIETKSYESHRRTQDGQVVHEETKRHSEKITDDNGDVSKSVESESCVKPQKVDGKVGSVSVNREIDENSKGGCLNRDSGTTKIFGDDFLRVTRREKVDDNFDFSTVPRRPNRIALNDNRHSEEFGRHRAWESRSNLSVVDECPENVTRPLAREDNLCRGQRSTTEIKAPRLSDLDTNVPDFSHHFDSLQNKVTQRRSMIDTTPITRHVGQNGTQRRLSLPKDFHEKQLQYIRQKEAELQAEFEKLELDRKRLEEEITTMRASTIRDESQTKRSSLLSEEEMFRQQMHSEWLDKVAEREERRLQKIIKITKPTEEVPQPPKSLPVDIENEFLRKVKERRTKLSMPADSDWESGAESQPQARDPSKEPKVHNIEVKVIDGEKEASIKKLPKHLQEFAESFTTVTSHGIWSPANKSEPNVSESQPKSPESSDGAIPLPPPPPVWTPRSAGPSPQLGGRKVEFRPVPFESPTLTRRRFTRNPSEPSSPPVQPPWAHPGFEKPPEIPASPTNSVQRLVQSFSAPGLNHLGTTQLPRSQNPTVTLLQKAREERSSKVSQADTRAKPNEIIHPIKQEYSSTESGCDYGKNTMTEVAPRQFESVGQTPREGMPLVLRSEIRDDNQSKWYKKVYNTIHKAKDDDEYVTVRYKTRRGRYPYKANGYMSEPEPNYDSDYSFKYSTLDRRRTPSAGSQYDDSRTYGTMPNPIRSGHTSYRNQPGRIENYIPGRSSVSERETREWWDEVMDIFDGWLDENSSRPLFSIILAREVNKFHLEQQRMANNYSQGYLSRALKEQGYESDSSLVFRKRDDATLPPLSPVEQKQAYKNVQAGGEPPLQGFRKPAPEKPKESPRRYVESDVNIHYRSPIRYEYKDPIPEAELARRQAEAMKRLYEEQRRRKYLQELQDMSNRRHTDLHPNQKSPIALDRYDDFGDDDYNKQLLPRTVARALYNFQGQSAKELSFKKGDIIYVRRQIDQNWYEGEHNAMLGLFPSSYVEIISKDGVRCPPKPKPAEGQARAKYNFNAQSSIELSLNKGELVKLTRRVDDNWFEGRIANRKGIFPVAYVEVLTDIGTDDAHMTLAKPVGSPAAHSLITPPQEVSPYTRETRFELEAPVVGENGVIREMKSVKKTEVLHVDTNSDPIPYRALYKYKPQNPDEMEMDEGDIVYVLEKCDDGWFVGTSQRTGCFGTFPGNYVEKL